MCGNNFSKGQRILVNGHLQIDSFDGKDGSKHTAARVIVEDFYFIERKSQQTATQAQSNTMESFGNAIPFEEVPF